MTDKKRVSPQFEGKEKDAIKDIFEVNLKAPQTTHKSIENDPQTTHNVGPLVKRHIRITDDDWQRLQIHFRSQSLTISAGIRMIIKEYMEREGI